MFIRYHLISFLKDTLKTSYVLILNMVLSGCILHVTFDMWLIWKKRNNNLRDNFLQRSKSNSNNSEQHRWGWARYSGEAEAVLPLLQIDHALSLLATAYGKKRKIITRLSIIYIYIYVTLILDHVADNTYVQEWEGRDDTSIFHSKQTN